MASLPEQSTAARADVAPRLGVLWVPDWPVVAVATERQLPADLPVAVHDARGVLAASAPARALGVRRGMRRRSAQEICPELVLVPADPGRDVRAFEEVVQTIEGLVADLEVVRPGMVLFAAAGPSRYLGGESALGDALVGAVADEVGVECQVGVAEGYLTAVLAARDGVTVAPGTAREFLAGRDVRALLHAATTREASAAWTDLVDLLRRLGLMRLGDVAALRSADVAARFGELGVQAHRLARGLDARRPVVHRPDPDIAVRADLDPPAARIDTAAFAARRLAEDLQSRLMRRGAVCARLAVTARATTGAELTRTWRIEGALTVSELTDRVRWQLEGWLGGRSGRAPSAPLARIELHAQEVSAAGMAQDGLWGRRARGELQASRAALRVQGLLGPERVLVPVREGGRAPRDRVRLVAWGDETTPLRRPDAPWPGSIPPPLPSVVPLDPPRVQLRDAVGSDVTVDARGRLLGVPATLHVTAGPAAAASRGRGAAARPGAGGAAGAGGVGWLVPGVHRVLTSAGPWQVTERWWTARSRAGAWLQVEVARVGEGVVDDGAVRGAAEREGVVRDGVVRSGAARGGVVLLAFHDGAWWVEGVHD